MTVQELCLRLSLFCASLCGAEKEHDDESIDPEEIAAIREEETKERAKKIQDEFKRLAFGATMGEVISWGKKEKEEDRQQFMATYGRHGSDM